MPKELHASKYLLRIYFSNKYAYAQVISPETRQICLGVSTIERSLREALPKGSDTQASSTVGELLAQRARERNIPAVHWQRRHGQQFHGKARAMLEAMQRAGLPLY